MAEQYSTKHNELYNKIINSIGNNRLQNNEYYHIGNIVGTQKYMSEGFHITKDLHQCIEIKLNKHKDAEYLYIVKFDKQNGLQFNSEPMNWSAFSLASLLLYNMILDAKNTMTDISEIDEVYHIPCKNMPTLTESDEIVLRQILKKKSTSAQDFGKIANILNRYNLNYVKYTNLGETDYLTDTVIPLEQGLHCEKIYEFGR